MTLVVQRLRSQLPEEVLAIGTDPPRLSWQVSASHSGLVQLGYEVEASGSPGFEPVLATTGERDGDLQVGVAAPGGALRSREVRYYRVRVQDAVARVRAPVAQSAVPAPEAAAEPAALQPPRRVRAFASGT